MKLGDPFYKHPANVDMYARIDDRRAPNVKQYMRGLRKYQKLSRQIERPYNYHLKLLMLPAAYFGVKLLKHSL